MKACVSRNGTRKGMGTRLEICKPRDNKGQSKSGTQMPPGNTWASVTYGKGLSEFVEVDY